MRASHAPAFASVGEFSDEAEGLAAVDKAYVGLPSPLVEIRAPVDDAFAEVLFGELGALEDLAGFRIGGNEGGLPLAAGAFVEFTVKVHETFGVAGGRVWIGFDNGVALDRRAGRCKSESEMKSE